MIAAVPETACSETKMPSPAFTIVLFAGALFFLGLSAVFLLNHTFVFRDVEASLPIAARLPTLEARLHILEEQVELSELHAATRTGSAEEQLHMFVLPKDGNLDRLLAFFEILQTALEKRGEIRAMTPIDVSERRPVTDAELPGSLFAESLRFSATVTEEGLRNLLSAIDLAGMLTVGDALSEEEQELLFRTTEEENPAGIVALEQFLSTDLLAYAKDPRPYTERLRRSYSSDGFTKTFENIIRSSLLSEATGLIRGNLGSALEKGDLWPLQFLSIEDAELEELADGTFKVTLQVMAYSR